ncbi:hypothetical protein F5884DRAFT_27498 [Xylogone sp. PMI_703]|nr:hypothetical protein F5884DRAFT_27498 [Xylogone sp. PMI_703]
MEIHEKNLIYALCAMTATHMSGRPEYNEGQLSWISLGRFFLGKCIATRQAYDFIEDRTLFAVISSYFLFEAYFELDEQRKSWYYLQEATTLAQELGLQEESSYTGLPFIESVCRRRTFWLLFVTERAVAVFRHKPLKLSKTPEYPLEKLDYEGIEVQQSLMSLIQTFKPLDADFMNVWNQSDYDISNPRLGTTWSENDLDAAQTDFTIFADSQKADVLVTQQWVRLLVWQCALRKGLLSSLSQNPSMTFKYPLEIASSLIGIVSRIPKSSIMVHGLGIFEKIFDIACSVIDVASTHNLDLIELNTPDYIGSHTFLTFMQVLSFTPNSEKIFATALREKAANQPEILRSAIRSGLTMLAPHHRHHVQQQRPLQHQATVESVIEEEEDATPTATPIPVHI